MTPTQKAAMEMALACLVRAETLYGQPNQKEQKALRAALAERQPLFKPLIDQHPGLAEELAEQADDKADAERYRWLVGGRTLEQCNDAALGKPADLPQDHVLTQLCMWYCPKETADQMIDAARSKP